jgi:hypothetical protein
MSRATERLTSLFAGAIVSAVAISAIAVAAPPSLPPPSPPAGPLPVPYPDPEPPPVPECPYSLCPKAAAPLQMQAVPEASAQTSSRDPASGLPTGKRMHKPVTAARQSDALSCDTHAQPGSGLASDPEAGGQIARNGAAGSDATEGGGVTTADKAAKRKGKVNPGKMNFTHFYDQSSVVIGRESPPPSNCQ